MLHTEQVTNIVFINLFTTWATVIVWGPYSCVSSQSFCLLYWEKCYFLHLFLLLLNGWQFYIYYYTRWRSCLMYCATSREVAGSNPDGVIGIFHWHNPSGHSMAPGLTQPLTEMSTRYISWGLRRPVHRADDLTTFVCWLSWNLGASASWNPQSLSTPIMGLLYLLIVQQRNGNLRTRKSCNALTYNCLTL